MKQNSKPAYTNLLQTLFFSLFTILQSCNHCFVRLFYLEQQLKAARSRALQVNEPTSKSGGEPAPPPPPSGTPGGMASAAGKMNESGAEESGSAAIWKAKAKALEEQLVENARMFAGQLSQVKLQLMEAEMGGGSSDESDSD